MDKAFVTLLLFRDLAAEAGVKADVVGRVFELFEARPEIIRGAPVGSYKMAKDLAALASGVRPTPGEHAWIYFYSDLLAGLF